MQEVVIQRIDLSGEERLEVEKFLSTFNLFFDRGIEYTIVARREEEILGTCSYSGKVLKCFAVKEGLQGEGIASKLITHLTNVLFDKNIYEYFVFTKPKNIPIFKGLNFKEICTIEEVSLLEGGMASIYKSTQNMYQKSGLGDGEKAALVMNCNPFTLGHRYLVEKASQENQEVIVFVVEEERSLFPFSVRMDLVKKGTQDLENVHVLPGGDYIISSATFPSYFLREESQRNMVYAKLDAEIFARYIAPVFHIERRYIGTEPYSGMTNQYHKVLSTILPKQGIEVVEVNRLEKDDRAISASKVRKSIKMGNFQELERLLPPTTYEYIMSPSAKSVVEKIQRSDTIVDQ